MSTQNILSTTTNTVMTSPASGQSFDDVYEQLQAECPTCRGTGRISKESEQGMVALIPFSDSRLKPRRTWLWVTIAVLLCLLIGGILLFFLLPRTVSIESTEPYLNPIKASNKSTNASTADKFVEFTIVNVYNITNGNYFVIDVTNLSMTVLLYGNTIVAQTYNSTVTTIPMHSITEVFVQIDIKYHGETEYLVDFCCDDRKWVHTQYLNFELTAQFTYLGHTEQVTKNTYQRVSCYPVFPIKPITYTHLQATRATILRTI